MGVVPLLSSVADFLIKTVIGRIIIAAIAVLSTFGIVSHHYTNKERELWRSAVREKQLILDDRYRRIQAITKAAERVNSSGLDILSNRYNHARESLSHAAPVGMVGSNVVDLINEGRGIPDAE